MQDAFTPSVMPIRVNFGNWITFIKEAGYKPKKSEFSAEARVNSANSRRGKKGGNNKGGRIKDNNGYVLIWKPGHPNTKSAGYLHEHRFVMSEHIGRPLEPHESVHHKNGVRDDNRLSNLELWSTMQPSGQRVSDKLTYAREIIRLYGNIHDNSELIKQL